MEAPPTNDIVPVKVPKKRKRTELSLATKIEILRLYEESDGKKGLQSRLAKQFGISTAAVSTLLKNRSIVRQRWEEIGETSSLKSRHHSGKWPEIEEAVKLFIHDTSLQDPSMPLPDSTVLEFANNFAINQGIDDFKASVAWLNRAKRRKGIKVVETPDENSQVHDSKLIEKTKDCGLSEKSHFVRDEETRSGLDYKNQEAGKAESLQTLAALQAEILHAVCHPPFQQQFRQVNALPRAADISQPSLKYDVNATE